MADDGSGADITIPSFLLYKPDADAIKEKLRQESLVQVEGREGGREKMEGGCVCLMVLGCPDTSLFSTHAPPSFPPSPLYLGGNDLVPAHARRPRRVEPLDVSERHLVGWSEGGFQGGHDGAGAASVLHAVLPGREGGREGGRVQPGAYRLLVSFQCATIVSHPALPPSLPFFPSQVYDGASYNCVNFPDHCGSLCTNHGRYCMPDPDKDPYHGYSGRDIVIENLRYVPPSLPPLLPSLQNRVQNEKICPNA